MREEYSASVLKRISNKKYISNKSILELFNKVSYAFYTTWIILCFLLVSYLYNEIVPAIEVAFSAGVVIFVSIGILLERKYLEPLKQEIYRMWGDRWDGALAVAYEIADTYERKDISDDIKQYLGADRVCPPE